MNIHTGACKYADMAASGVRVNASRLLNLLLLFPLTWLVGGGSDSTGNGRWDDENDDVDEPPNPVENT